jgi:putative transposase
MGNKRIAFKPETIYHIYNHCIGSSNLFMEDANYEYFLDLFKKHIWPFTEIYAFCLMPNHFHFLLKIGPLALIEEHMRLKEYIISTRNSLEIHNKIAHLFGNFFNAYAKGINKRYFRMGSLFVAKVKRKIVYDDEYLKQLILYINTNPIHHGYSIKLDEWPYSSYIQTIHKNSFLISYIKTLFYFESLEEFKLQHETYLDKIKKAGETGPLNSVII